MRLPWPQLARIGFFLDLRCIGSYGRSHQMGAWIEDQPLWHTTLCRIIAGLCNFTSGYLGAAIIGSNNLPHASTFRGF
jgi:hypothetical protein